MPKLAMLGAVVALWFGYSACRTTGNNAKVKDDNNGNDASALDNRSPNGGLMGSSDRSKSFRIKGDYPGTLTFYTAEPPMPDMDRLRKGGSDPDAVAAAKAWMTAIQAYIYEDMKDSGFALSSRPSDPSAYRPSNARWYHMPWLHTPNATDKKPGRGREGLLGLTREADFKGPVTKWPKVAGKVPMATDWGIGFYNEPGGYAIGQVFPPGTQVNPSFRSSNGQIFPKKTVSFKILFTTAAAIPSPDGDPDLAEGALTTTALINGGGDMRNANGPRSQTQVRHIQMDVDLRYGDGPDDWIFGNWVYDKNSRGDQSLWQGMRPMGVQFGTNLAQSIIFSDQFEANGFRAADESYSRLNGPADNPMSSCYSCHARSQWPEAAYKRLPFAPFNAQDDKMVCLLHDWKGEAACGIACDDSTGCIPPDTAPVVPQAIGLDYSLQMALALRNQQITAGG